MTILFTNLRLIAYVFVFLLSGTVLGLAANFARLFLPDINHDFTIFSLVVPSLTILLFMLLVQFAQPIIEVAVHFVLGVLWLAMGAWSADIIGYVQCYALGGQQQPTKDGTMDARAYCYEMKVIEAFSWAIFVSLIFFFIIIIALTTRAVAFGRRYAWHEHISQLGWFNQFPGYPTEVVYPQAQPMNYNSYSGQPGTPYNAMSGNVIQQMPGHSVVIQPGINGGMPTISQVPSV
ncbi:hypothetical protein CONPUDRAFT_139571 [Coniophora puteana RWD-64-598 SS2]|uniref:MARVEL domain-containing protein n=1 Tax=Coniophora puteana (strain RWD-64-598) TaxID=741705 RepID=A0A5M3MA41_CONPW|nr:uncharacterized protein CONPUDRAFT_139571 [Coniophora puteana RWD-64-598 SS2]EIW76118.1 hypothetical protein CONPUDRAFT_139571 [Coniophora puteana RWD-64-598 SS2]